MLGHASEVLGMFMGGVWDLFEVLGEAFEQIWGTFFAHAWKSLGTIWGCVRQFSKHALEETIKKTNKDSTK